jgi:hypothetical protein
MKKILFALAVLILLGGVVWSLFSEEEVTIAPQTKASEDFRVLQVVMEINFPGEEHSALVISRIFYNSTDANFFNSTNAHEAVRIAEPMVISEKLTVTMLGTFLDGEMMNLYVCSLKAEEGCVESTALKEGHEMLAIVRGRMIIYYGLYQQRLEEEMKKALKTPEKQQPEEEAPEKIIV